MSSLTISITVCGLAQPCSSVRGLYTRSFGDPVEKRLANPRWARAAPYRSSGARLERSSKSTLV
jgi:hypothetical protein